MKRLIRIWVLRWLYEDVDKYIKSLYAEKSFPEPTERIIRELKSFGYKLRYKYNGELEEAYYRIKSYLN